MTPKKVVGAAIIAAIISVVFIIITSTVQEGNLRSVLIGLSTGIIVFVASRFAGNSNK